MHDRATRARARQLAETEGITAAAEATGVSRAQLYVWAKAEGWTLHRDNPTPTHPAAGEKGSPSDSSSAVWVGRNGHGGHAPSPLQLGRRFLAEAGLFLDAARVAREQRHPRDAREYMTGAAIASDKARQAGVTEDQDSLERLTPEQMEVRWWAFRAKLAATRDAIATRQTAAAEGMDDIAPPGWDAHLHHPDPAYRDRVGYQRRLDELLKANGHDYPAAMRQLAAEGWD